MLIRFTPNKIRVCYICIIRRRCQRKRIPWSCCWAFLRSRPQRCRSRRFCLCTFVKKIQKTTPSPSPRVAYCVSLYKIKVVLLVFLIKLCVCLCVLALKEGGIDRRGRWDGMMCCGVQPFQTPNPKPPARKKERGFSYEKTRCVLFFPLGGKERV